MKTLITALLLIPSLGFSQYDTRPQFGAFLNGGVRDFTTGNPTIKSTFGIDAGVNIKHYTENGRLRLVYAVGMTFDRYKLEDKTVINRFTDIDQRVKGISVLFRPEFKIVNREKLSMHAGVGPRFSALYSFMEKRVTIENGISITENWQKRGSNEVGYFGIHAAISVDYKFDEHWALNLGLNAFGGFEFEFFDGNSYSGANLTTGMAYVF